jgi:hypothetical protein
MYTERSALVLQGTTLLSHCTTIGVLLGSGGNDDGHGPAGWAQPALSTRAYTDRRDNTVSP